MHADEKIVLKWHGVAHFHIFYKGLTIVIDPIFQRAPAAKPVLETSRQDIDNVDYLLLTHAHVDHSWDFPYLASRHQPNVYVPEDYRDFLQKKESKWNLRFSFSKMHVLEQMAGDTFTIDDIVVTPYRVGTEKVDISVIYQSVWRGLRHMSFGATSAGLKFLFYHLKGNCFAYHFDFPSIDKTMLFFGNVTDQVYDMQAVSQVDVLAIPFCPASSEWLDHTLYLINRFKSEVVLVHHFDNFWHPITHPTYRNLKEYQKTIQTSFPETKLAFAKFMQEVNFLDIL